MVESIEFSHLVVELRAAVDELRRYYCDELKYNKVHIATPVHGTGNSLVVKKVVVSR